MLFFNIENSFAYIVLEDWRKCIKENKAIETSKPIRIKYSFFIYGCIYSCKAHSQFIHSFLSTASWKNDFTSVVSKGFIVSQICSNLNITEEYLHCCSFATSCTHYNMDMFYWGIKRRFVTITTWISVAIYFNDDTIYKLTLSTIRIYIICQRYIWHWVRLKNQSVDLCMPYRLNDYLRLYIYTAKCALFWEHSCKENASMLAWSSRTYVCSAINSPLSFLYTSVGLFT